MKCAVVLFQDKTGGLGRAADVEALLPGVAHDISELELWLFHQDPPTAFPQFCLPLSRIRLIPIEAACSAEAILYALDQMAKKEKMNLFLFGGDALGRELATRLAFRLNGSAAAGIDACGRKKDIGTMVASRPAYGSHMIADIELGPPPWCIAGAKSCRPMPRTDPSPCPVEKETGLKQLAHNPCKKHEVIRDERETGLETAARVLAVGNGTGSKENTEEFSKVAWALGMEIGGSRPVVMNGWLPMNRMIGASGTVTAPGLCIAAGVSGAGAFCIGICQSRLIVAVNTDPGAPIFDVADLGVVADMNDFLAALEDWAGEGRF